MTFFGEAVNSQFTRTLEADFSSCDLLIVMGTSLLVYPFAGLTGRVGPFVPRLLLNREATGLWRGLDTKARAKWNYRDVVEHCCGLLKVVVQLWCLAAHHDGYGDH